MTLKEVVTTEKEKEKKEKGNKTEKGNAKLSQKSPRSSSEQMYQSSGTVQVVFTELSLTR